jgi:hypothetical protein
LRIDGLVRSTLDAGRVCRYCKQRDAILSRLLARRSRGNNYDFCVAAVQYTGLGAIQDKTFAVNLRGGFDVGDIEAPLRFSERQRGL